MAGPSMEAALQETRRDVANVIPLRFWSDHERQADGTFKEFVKVEIVKKGSNGSTNVDKISRIQKHNAPVWAAIEPYYVAWQKGQEPPVEGTPLEVCAFVSKGQIDQLKMLHIRSAEDLAEANEPALEKIGMGARALRDKARAFVSANKGQAVIAEAMASKDAQISTLQQQIADLQAGMAELTANLPKRKMPRDKAAE